MLFKFDIKINDHDYLEYNNFVILKSNYGKKQLTSFRIIMAALLAVWILFLLYNGGFSKDAFINIIPQVVLLVLFQVVLTPFFKFVMKGTVKRLIKNGKKAYSPNSVMEFYDNDFKEITDDNETKQKYTAIDRVSIIEGKNIYIHINSLMAYILPFACFESDEQRQAFIEFLKTKCNNVDVMQ